MVQKINNLTLRQAQALMSVSYWTKVFGFVTLENLISDMGVSFTTLALHLLNLQTYGLIQTPNSNSPRNLNFSDRISITPEGENIAQNFMHLLGYDNYNNCNPKRIFEKLRLSYEPKPPKTVQLNLYFRPTTTASFGKAFEQIVAKNPTEPVLTSIAMYTELDSQLSLLKLRNPKEYKAISSARMNIEVRNGRLASMAIPVALRAPSSLRASELWRILQNSWSWMGTVDHRSRDRYWQESCSLGLMQSNGDLLTSMKPTAIDTISWLADKTHFTFINTIPIAPKASLVLFKESFKFPTMDDLLNPQNSKVELPWLSIIREGVIDKGDYIQTIRDGLKLVMDQTNIVQFQGKHIVPATILRRMKQNSEMGERFKTLLNYDSTQASRILIIISAKPGITVSELYLDLKNESHHHLDVQDIWQSISILAANKLIHFANSRSVENESTRLYSFIHLPYIDTGKGKQDETNAVLRGIKPYLLQLITELFASANEREALKETLSKLLKGETILFDDIERIYDKTLMRKMLIFGRSIDPFAQLDSDYKAITLNQNNFAVNKILLDSLLYSVITQNEGLSIYAQTIASLVEKDSPWASRVEDEVAGMTEALMKPNIRDSS